METDLSVQIKINGSLLNSSYEVVSVKVSRQNQFLATADITIRDGSPETGEFAATDSGDFVSDNTIEIFAGYGPDDCKLIFSGRVRRKILKIDTERHSYLIVNCYQADLPEFSSEENPGKFPDPVLTVSYGENIISLEVIEQPRLASVEGTVLIRGTAGVNVADRIEIKGVGKQFSGNAGIAGISHSIKDGNWLTTLEFGLKESVEVILTEPPKLL